MIQLNIGGTVRWVDTLPNRCPQCHHAIDPRPLGGVVRTHEVMGRSAIEAFFQCPQRDCLCAFIGRYVGEYDRSANEHRYHLRSTTPFAPEPPQHSPEVVAVSPQFVAIFAESSAANGWGLKEIAGCGYRKALEFLVKDYCAKLVPERAEEIKARLLGQVIDDFVPDVGIKACAKRAAWLGNDETHYARRWTEHDLEDLKKLIALTESWITTAERTKAYLAAMPDKK